MAENISIIDLTEDSFTEEYVSTGDNLSFEPNSVGSLTGSSVADQSLIFVGESVRPSRVPFRSVGNPRSVQQPRITRNQTPPKRMEPKPKANTAKKLASKLAKPPAEVEPSPPVADQPTCPICMETFSEIKASQRTLMTTQCGHIFCSRCLEMVKKPYRSNSTSTGRKFVVQCPTCRKTWHWASYHPIYL